MESLKNFGRSTSIKGIPRAFKTTSKPMRYVWVICVLCFLFTGSYQAYTLTNEYLSYTVTTSLKEYPLDTTGYTENTVELPHMTFCNVNPFGSNASMLSDVPTLEEFHSAVVEATDCSDCPEDIAEFFLGARRTLLKPSYYYGYIGVDNVRRIGHSIESMLVACQLVLLEGKDTRMVPCFPSAEIVLLNDVDHYNCYTLKLPPPSWPYFLYVGFTMVFHLDDFFADHLQYLGESTINLGASGIDFYMHHPTQPPVIGRDGITLPPGFTSNVKLRFRKHKRLPEPFGNCQENGNHGNSPYSQDLCYALCAQRLVSEICGCLDYNSYTDTYFDIDTNNSMCMELLHNRTTLYHRWLCLLVQRNMAVSLCGSQCAMPCEQLIYKTKVSYVAWPTKPLVGGFYESYIAGRSFEHRYAQIRDLDPVNISHTEQYAAEQLIKDNFLRVYVLSDEQMMIEYVDSPMLTLVSFISQLGGALNLWAGITVIIVVELMELTVEILCSREKTSKTKVTTLENEDKG